MPFKSTKQRKGFFSHNKTISRSKRFKMSMKNKRQTSEERARMKFNKVLNEYEAGNLYSSDGGMIIDKKQALAIAYSEARKKDASFGKHSLSNRSENSLTPIERKAIKTSISEEKQAQRDYTQRSKKSRSKRVKSTFNHIKKEEKHHEKELNELL